MKKKKGLKISSNCFKREKGVAIILSLVFIALLSILVVEFLYEAEVEATLANTHEGELEAFLAAKSAVAKALAFLAEDNLNTMMSGAPPVDSDFDLLSFNMGESMEPINEAFMHASISDEYGKINLNALLIPQSGGEPQERTPLVNALREFFILRDTGKGASAEAIVDAILDWLDYNDGDSERPQGAENDYYMSLENPYPCKNGPMDSIEELLLIKGITPQLYFGDPEMGQLPLSEYLTVHGDWLGRVNVNSAREDVIAAIIAGYTNNPADRGLGQRIYDDAHTQPFTDLSQLDAYGFVPKTAPNQPTLRDVKQQKPTITPAERPTNPPARHYSMANQFFTLRSNVFRIFGDGLYKDTMVRIETYIFRNPNWVDQGVIIPNAPGTSVPNRSGRGSTVKNRDPLSPTQGVSNVPVSGQEPYTLPPEPFRILDWKIIK